MNAQQASTDSTEGFAASSAAPVVHCPSHRHSDRQSSPCEFDGSIAPSGPSQRGHIVQCYARRCRDARGCPHSGRWQSDADRGRPRDRSARRPCQCDVPRLGHQQGAAGRCLHGRHRRHHRLDQAARWPRTSECGCRLGRPASDPAGQRCRRSCPGRDQEARRRQRHRPGRIRAGCVGCCRTGCRAERRWWRRQQQCSVLHPGCRRVRRGCGFRCGRRCGCGC
jgi:hypothetical protein